MSLKTLMDRYLFNNLGVSILLSHFCVWLNIIGLLINRNIRN